MTDQAKNLSARVKRAYATKHKSAIIKGLFILFILVGLSLAWRYTLVSEWINFKTVIAWQESIKNHPGAVFVVVAAYVIGSLVLFPVTILNVATIFTFGPILGNLYSLAGWLCSAAMGYGIGRGLGHHLFHETAGPRLERYLRSEKHGFFTVLTVRLLPVAPFTVVNMFIGASTIRFRDFLLGSAVGRIPGMIMLAFAGVQLELILSNPEVGTVVALALTLIVLPLAIAWLMKRLHARAELQRHPSKI
jgi:phospholipase D1/2